MKPNMFYSLACHLLPLWEKVGMRGGSRAFAFLAFLAFFAVPAWAVGPTLVVCDDVADPLSLNPLKEFDVRSDNVVFQMFEGLLRFSDDGKLEPCLATSWKRIDPLTVEFTLRPDVVFHNGEPFTAEAVKFSIDKLLDPNTRALCYPQISTIDRVEVVDLHTVRIVTKMPDGLLLHRLPAFVKILPPLYYKEVGDDGFDRHPIGTGPFKFVEWKKGERIVLAAHERYWEKGFPKVGAVVFRFVPTDQQVPLLLKGELDLVTELPGTYTREVMKNPRTKVVKRASLVFPSFLLCQQGPLQDRRVRLALNYAVDRRALVRYLAYGNGLPMAAWSMPGEVGHDSDLTPFPHDERKAKKLLKEAGWEKGLTIRMIVSDQAAREGAALSAQLEKVGVQVTLLVMPMSQIFQEWGRPEKRWECFGNLCPDPMGHVAFIYGLGMYSRSPFSGYQDPKFDALYERMLTTVEDQEHSRLAKEINRYVYENAMGLFTYQRMKVYGLKQEVVCTPHISGSLFLRNVKISKGRR